MLFLRVLIGFFQVFSCVYYPVWADTFGPEKHKTTWLTIMLLAAPLGVVLGYVLTYGMNYAYSWEWSFYLQALAIVPCAIFFLLTPDHYLNIQKTVEFRK